MRSRFRSAISGRFVAAATALKDPSRTVRERPQAIEVGLAQSIAGQVAVGLAAEHDGDVWAERERARATLLAIGLMVDNAIDDPHVHEVLALGSRSTVTRS